MNLKQFWQWLWIRGFRAGVAQFRASSHRGGRAVQERNEEWLDEATAAVEAEVAADDAAPAEAAATPVEPLSPPSPHSESSPEHPAPAAACSAAAGASQRGDESERAATRRTPQERRRRQREKMRALFDVDLDLSTWDMGDNESLHGGQSTERHSHASEHTQPRRAGALGGSDGKARGRRKKARRPRVRGEGAAQLDARHVVAQGAGAGEWFLE